MSTGSPSSSRRSTRRPDPRVGLVRTHRERACGPGRWKPDTPIAAAAALVPAAVRASQARPIPPDRENRAWSHERARYVSDRAVNRTLESLTGHRRWGRCVGLPEPELAPLRVLAGREPAHARNRHRLVRLPAEFRHTRRTCLDVVDREVRPHTALARLHVRDRRALLPANLRGVVLERARVRLEPPPEQRAPELLARLGVVRRDLDVHDLAWQRCLLVSSFTAMPPSVLIPPGPVRLIGRYPDGWLPDYFHTRDRILRARAPGIPGLPASGHSRGWRRGGRTRGSSTSASRPGRPPAVLAPGRPAPITGWHGQRMYQDGQSLLRWSIAVCVAQPQQ